MRIKLVTCLMLIALLLGCQPDSERGEVKTLSGPVQIQPDSERGEVKTPSGPVQIHYGYQGGDPVWAVIGIASSAEAYVGNVLVGKAKALRIIEMEQGPNAIEVEETHFSPSGSVIYKGIVVYSFGWRGSKLQERALRGKKRTDIFSSWPSG
ncbi:MAG: hypothetical protein P9M14_08755 [Candidatus Alcyoniella australis]|nr:hypothetical protein [Candidatus Alcyoniella australis]